MTKTFFPTECKNGREKENNKRKIQPLLLLLSSDLCSFICHMEKQVAQSLCVKNITPPVGNLVISQPIVTWGGGRGMINSFPNKKSMVYIFKHLATCPKFLFFFTPKPPQEF